MLLPGPGQGGDSPSVLDGSVVKTGVSESLQGVCEAGLF